jgi:ATP-dependent protease ClpP protease subunit
VTVKLGPYRYWGERKPDTKRPLLTVSRNLDAVPIKTGTAGTDDKPVAAATLRIYGPIDSWGGWWGVSAKEVSTALDLLGDVEQLVVRINSPGGDAFEGRAIMNLLRAHKATCIAVVDGLAASAASYIAVGCDETVMSPGTALMIHDTHTIIYGNAEDLRKQADVIDSISKSGAELYAEVAGGTVEKWRELQRVETWFTASEAVEANLADRVAVVPDLGPVETASGDEEPTLTCCGEEDERAAAEYDLSIFHFAGRDQAPTPQPPTASADGSTQPEGGPAVAFSDEQVTTMRQKLGIAENADEATILAALDEALSEQAEPTAVQIPEGHVVIPAAKLADLEAGAALAATTAKSLHDKERDAFLDSVRNKYLPTSRDGWAAEYDRDEEGVRAHFAKAPVLIATSELGHDNPVAENQAEDDEAYFSLFPDEKKGA